MRAHCGDPQTRCSLAGTLPPELRSLKSAPATSLQGQFSGLGMFMPPTPPRKPPYHASPAPCHFLYSLTVGYLWLHREGFGPGRREEFLYCGGCEHFNPGHRPRREAGGTGCAPCSGGCPSSFAARPGCGDSGPASGRHSRSAQSPERTQVPCRREGAIVETPATPKASTLSTSSSLRPRVQALPLLAH